MSKKCSTVVSLRGLERRRNEGRRFSDAYKTFLQKYSLKKVGIEKGFFKSARMKGTRRQRDCQ